MRIVVAGRAMTSSQPGAACAVLQYAAGFALLGHDVLLLEVGAAGPGSMDRLAAVARAGHHTGRVAIVETAGRTAGMAWRDVVAWTESSDLLVNLGGALRVTELVERSDRRLYVDVDPGFTQLWHAVEGVDMGFDGHDRFASFGAGFGTSDLPDCGRTWVPTLPPVVVDQWPVTSEPPDLGLTTLANWRSYGSIVHGGRHYGQKAHSFRQLLTLPERVAPIPVEPAVAIDPGDRCDRAALRCHGWRTLDPGVVAPDVPGYQRFIARSTAELGVAKAGYVTSRCGWFSDRSACYLASGRPVIAQDTGWPARLPSGRGLLAFAGVDDAAAAVDAILSTYPDHCRAARELAGDELDARRVLAALLEDVGS